MAHRGVARERFIDRLALARESIFIHAGAAAGPMRAIAAKQRGAKRGGRRGIADAHFA